MISETRDLQLSTPIAYLSMTDKLRNRLKMCGCHTFQQTMEIDHEKWTNVAPKVVNALKRFKDEYADVYSVLIKKSREKKSKVQGEPAENAALPYQQEEMSPDERRFYVANNILNAYIAAGKLFGSRRTYKSHMVEIMKAADAFMDAFESVPESMPEEASTEEASTEEPEAKVEKAEKPATRHKSERGRKRKQVESVNLFTEAVGDEPEAVKPMEENAEEAIENEQMEVDCVAPDPEDSVTIAESEDPTVEIAE